jgi:hypothetical protein
MKKLLPLILIITMLSSACEFSEMTITNNINVNKTYDVDKTGPYSGSAIVSYDEVLGNLDIPDNVRIDEVSIESLSAKVVVLADNQATAVKLNGNVQLGSSSPEVFNNYYAPLVAVDNKYIGINTLINDGIQGLKSKLEGYLKSKDFSAFTINIGATSSPIEGKRIHAQVLLRITGTVKYTNCVYLPFILGGASCGL